MTFTFKLSRRLARLRAIPLLAVILFTISCEGGNANPTDPYGSDGSTSFPGGISPEESLSATGGRPRKPSVSQVNVSPAATTLRPGATQTFGAVAMRSNGNRVYASILWTATGGVIDTIGQYTAGQVAGEFVVVATTYSGVSDTAAVTIATSDSGTASQVVLTPTSASLVVGGSQDFSAIGETNSGSPVTITPIYAATAGTISSTGKYRAPNTPGRYRVTVTDAVSGTADSAAVTVTDTPPVLSQVVLSPNTASLTVGGSQQFSAVGQASDGSAITITPTYSATGGTISSSGVYTAGQTAGTYRVIGAASGKADTATVTVAAVTPPAPVLAQVVLNPTSASLAPGAAKQFTAAGKAADGTAVGMNPIFAATGGAISASGVYTAGSTAGAYRVIARDSATGKADTAAVTITAPSPTLQAVVLSPATVSLASAGTQQFAAAGKMSDGSTTPVSVTWSAAGGTISSSGFYSAGQTAGSYRVVATVAGGKADTAAVTITAPLPPPTGGCDTDKTNLLFLGNMETTPPPFPRMTNQGNAWFGMEMSQVGSYPHSFTQVTSPVRECGAAVRFELDRTDSVIAGQKRGQIINVYPAGYGGVPLPSGESIGGGLGDERWIGFSVYIPSTWVFETGYAPETIFEMLEASRTPGFAIDIDQGNWRIHNQTGHGPQNDPSWIARYDYTPVARGAWTDWVIHVVWSGGSAGVLEIWKNGVLVVNRSNTWTTYTDAGNAKVDWGIYKWSWNGANSGGSSIVSERDLVLDAIRITDGAHGSYAAVAPR